MVMDQSTFSLASVTADIITMSVRELKRGEVSKALKRLEAFVVDLDGLVGFKPPVTATDGLEPGDRT